MWYTPCPLQTHTTDLPADHEGRGLQSVTETGDLDEFLTTAEMSGREFLGGMRALGILNFSLHL